MPLLIISRSSFHTEFNIDVLKNVKNQHTLFQHFQKDFYTIVRLIHDLKKVHLGTTVKIEALAMYHLQSSRKSFQMISLSKVH